MSISMDKPAQDLRRAREAVQATIAGAIGTTPPAVTSSTPIRGLPEDIVAKARRRAQAGYRPVGTDSPGAATMRKVVWPSAALAVLDAVLLVVALVSGSTVSAVVAVALLVVFAGAAIVGQRTVARDDLRLTALERVAIARAGRWTSAQKWTGPIAATPECALIVAAARAGQRIVSSAPWHSGELARSGVPLAVGPELDQVDANAFELASHRYPDFPGGLPGAPLRTPELDDAWEKTLTRVAALTAYADTLDGRLAAQDAALTQPGQVTDAQLRADDVALLAFYLSPAIYDVN